MFMELGVVEKSVSKWAENNVSVLKKDNGVRVTTFYRALSNITVSYSYSMEDVRKMVERLATKKVFGVFGLKDGLYQVELDEEFR